MRFGVNSPAGRDHRKQRPPGQAATAQSAVLLEDSRHVLCLARLTCIPWENVRGSGTQGHGQLCSFLPGSAIELPLSKSQRCKWMQRSPDTQAYMGGPDFCRGRAFWVLGRVLWHCLCPFSFWFYVFLNKIFPKAGQYKIKNSGIKRKHI